MVRVPRVLAEGAQARPSIHRGQNQHVGAGEQIVGNGSVGEEKSGATTRLARRTQRARWVQANGILATPIGGELDGKTAKGKVSRGAAQRKYNARGPSSGLRTAGDG